MTLDGWRLDKQRLYEVLRGSGDPEAIAVLDQVWRSKNLLLLRGLLDVAEISEIGAARVAQLRDNFAAISAIESFNSRQCANMIMHPHVGAWLATCLKHMSINRRVDLPRPLWADLGHLGAITIAAAMAAGAAVEAAVPAYEGMVYIPAVGRIHIGGAPSWRMTTLRHLGDGTLQVADGRKVIAASNPGQGIYSLRRLSVSCNGLELSLELDDLNPYRDCHQLGASGRLPESDVREWRRKLAESWTILATRHRGVAESVAGMLHTLVPLRPRGLSGVSATSRHAPGALALTPPQDGMRFACTLVHELQHTKLCLLMELAPLSRAARGLFYSPWRNDPRPLTGLLQGLYAGVAVADFWRVEKQYGGANSAVAFQFARARRQVEIALHSLADLGVHADEALIAAVRDVAISSPDAPVFPRCARLAGDVTLDHAVRWKLRNLAPANGDVERLAASWWAGRPPPVPRAPVMRSSTAESFVEDLRLRMIYGRLLDEDACRPSARDEDKSRTSARPAISELSATATADVRWVSGDYQGAAAAYERDIRDGVHPAEAWAGLAVALHGQSEPVSALTLRPDLVRAVYEHLANANDIANPSPREVTRWLAASTYSGGE